MCLASQLSSSTMYSSELPADRTGEVVSSREGLMVPPRQ